MPMAFVIGSDVRSPILFEPANDLVGRQRQVLMQHVLQVFFWPIGIGLAQEGGDIIGIFLPLFLFETSWSWLSALAAFTTSAAIRM
jgi:cadmium resistance protein CadD (predicted permease)